MQHKSALSNNGNQLADQKTIGHLFTRYQNVLEIHLRYRQPPSTVMTPLVNGGKPAITKYCFTHMGVFAWSSLFAYFVLLASPSILATFSGLLRFFHLSPLIVGTGEGIAFLVFLLIILPLILPVSQVALLLPNLYLALGKEAYSALRGPTHISLSPLSMKLLWKGAIFSSIGAMFGWSEITSVDVDLPVDDTLAAPSVVITAQDGKIVHDVPVRLDGFFSDEDRLVFLNSVDNHVADDNKTALFKKYLADAQNVSLLLAKVKQCSIDGLLAESENQPCPNLLAMGGSKDEAVTGPSAVILTDPSRLEEPIYKSK